ncbi:MAG TPA: LLM class F420-dependent oxidoreductase [Candidatus Eisenbacteria bacterium]|nr:LLM class F420-dependent oxidoreductase [Candidatus Eisenbacteria bacterium]
MKIGVSVPNIGPVATPEAIKTVAQKAEALGYNSLWTVERLLWPVKPKLPYPVTPDGSLPDEYKYTLDPLDTLTFAAAHTSKIKLGTSVLDMPYYTPVMLARRLSAIDILSRGRLNVGLGLGWSPDEMEAAGADMKVRGAQADEFIQVLKAIWTTDPAEFHGKFFSLPKSYINAKPVQKPHPPIFIAAFAPPALKRVATVADGWNPTGLPVEAMAQIFGAIRQMAEAVGRNPAELKMIVRGNLVETPKPVEKDRAIFVGSLDQVREDIAACEKIGAEEVFLELAFTPGGQQLSNWVRLLEEFKPR